MTATGVFLLNCKILCMDRGKISSYTPIYSQTYNRVPGTLYGRAAFESREQVD